MITLFPNLFLSDIKYINGVKCIHLTYGEQLYADS